MSVIVHLRPIAPSSMSIGPTVRKVTIARGVTFDTTYTDQGDLYVFDEKNECIQAFAPGAWESVEIVDEPNLVDTKAIAETISAGRIKLDVKAGDISGLDEVIQAAIDKAFAKQDAALIDSIRKGLTMYTTGPNVTITNSGDAVKSDDKPE